MPSVHRIAGSPITWALTAIIMIVVGVGAALFQPWRLFTNTVVNEAAPTIAITSGAQPPQQPHTLSRGEFVSHEHQTSGSVLVLQLPDGTRVLRLENLDTSDGPDLHVWLSDAPVLNGRAGWFVFDDGRHTDLGSLKGNKGSQNYTIAPDTELHALTSVTIWCERFHVSFGAAQLQ